MTNKNFILLITFFASILGASYSSEVIEDSTYISNIEKSNVEDDIKELDIQPKDYLSSGIFYVAEDCYTGVYNENYNIYLYYYNKEFTSDVYLVNSTLNTINIGGEIKDDGTFSSYLTFNVDIVNYNTSKSLYKLKLKNDSDKRKLFELQDNTNYVRNYYISSSQFKMSDGTINRSLHSVSFEYTGFAKYMYLGNTESTINVKSNEMDVLDLEVKHDYYRLDNNYETDRVDMKTDIFTASFSIDKSFLDKYGEVAGIKYSYYNYKTPWIAYIKKQEDYLPLKEIEGQVFNEEQFKALDSESYDLKDFCFETRTIYNGEFVPTYYCTDVSVPTGMIDKGKFGVGGMDHDFVLSNEIKVPVIMYDESANWSDNDHLIDRTEVKSIVLKGADSWNGNEKDLNVSTNIWEYDGENRGYNEILLESLNDSITISSDYELSGWDWFINGLTWHGERNEEVLVNEVPLFQKLTKEDEINFYSNKEAYLKNNYISETLGNDVFSDINFDDKVTYLFRYKDSKFKASNFFVQDYHSSFEPASQGITYQSSVVLNFNLISFTFSKDGTSTVIPVVHQPFDEYTDLSHESNKGFDWMMVIYIVIAVIVLLILSPILIPLISFVLKLVIQIISLPFKIVGKLFSKK